MSVARRSGRLLRRFEEAAREDAEQEDVPLPAGGRGRGRCGGRAPRDGRRGGHRGGRGGRGGRAPVDPEEEEPEEEAEPEPELEQEQPAPPPNLAAVMALPTQLMQTIADAVVQNNNNRRNVRNQPESLQKSGRFHQAASTYL